MDKHKYYSGGLMVLIGLGTALGSLQYGTGTLARMGPGYFPLLLGMLLALLGLLIAFTPESPEEVEAGRHREPLRTLVRHHIRPWGASVGGMIAFIILGKFAGFLPATFALIFVAALGDPKNSLKACFWLAVGVVAFAVLAFHYGLQLQFPLFAWR